MCTYTTNLLCDDDSSGYDVVERECKRPVEGALTTFDTIVHICHLAILMVI